MVGNCAQSENLGWDLDYWPSINQLKRQSATQATLENEQDFHF